MKGMLKLMAILALCFASTFLVLNATGLLTIDRITHWLELAQQSSPILLGSIVAFLLFADLFVAMPTLTIMILSGFFLGPAIGAVFSILGLSLAGIFGYGLSHRYGNRLAKTLIRDEDELKSAVQSFRQFGTGTILLSRAAPILPEVSACMAGLTHMSKIRFAMAWGASTIPYAVIASYAGSISTLSDPKPAITAAIGLTAFFWLGWVAYRSLVIKKNTLK
ncbi:MAG: TVP38/TMEM64 family protein [Arenicella sp.]